MINLMAQQICYNRLDYLRFVLLTNLSFVFMTAGQGSQTQAQLESLLQTQQATCSAADSCKIAPMGSHPCLLR